MTKETQYVYTSYFWSFLKSFTPLWEAVHVAGRHRLVHQDGYIRLRVQCEHTMWVKDRLCLLHRRATQRRASVVHWSIHWWHGRCYWRKKSHLHTCLWWELRHQYHTCLDWRWSIRLRLPSWSECWPWRFGQWKCCWFPPLSILQLPPVRTHILSNHGVWHHSWSRRQRGSCWFEEWLQTLNWIAHHIHCDPLSSTVLSNSRQTRPRLGTHSWSQWWWWMRCPFHPRHEPVLIHCFGLPHIRHPWMVSYCSRRWWYWMRYSWYSKLYLATTQWSHHWFLPRTV